MCLQLSRGRPTVHSSDSTTLTEAEIRGLAARFGSPLLVLDCDQVRRQYHALRNALPGVDLHYALKPLPHAAVVSCLRDEGAFFDLATTGEVELVKAQGVAPERCIHTHPIKRDSDIRDALRYGVTTFFADNPDELGIRATQSGERGRVCPFRRRAVTRCAARCAELLPALVLVRRRRTGNGEDSNDKD